MPSTEHFPGIRPETVLLCGRDRCGPDAFPPREPAERVVDGCGQAVGMTTAPDPRLLAFVADARRGVLTTIKRDGRPQLSNVGYAWDSADGPGLIRVSVTDDRAKTRNLRRDPRVSLHVTSPDFWTWVVVEGTADLSPVAEDPHDATVEELITYYRGTAGEHPDWDDYRRAMVADRRLVVRFRPEHAYGQVSG
jgi:PPOX class probable F420-dependent enzyme